MEKFINITATRSVFSCGHTAKTLFHEDIVKRSKYFYDKVNNSLEEVQDISIKKKKTNAQLTITLKNNRNFSVDLRPYSISSDVRYKELNAPSYLYEHVANFNADVQDYLNKQERLRDDYLRNYESKKLEVQRVEKMRTTFKYRYAEELI